MTYYIDLPTIQALEKKTLVKEDLFKQLSSFVEDSKIQMVYNWPSLFECLNLNHVFDQMMKFDAQNPLFVHAINCIDTQIEQNEFYQLYDRIFLECLTDVKNLSEVNLEFLLEQIQSKKKFTTDDSENLFFHSLLEFYEKLIIQFPSEVKHDLVLYLAWDRMCLCLAALFEYEPNNLTRKKSLLLLLECLIESFQHIFEQKKTVPTFFRFVEALFAFQMRDENLQTHSEQEWQLLCQSVRVLKPQNRFINLFYIDSALIVGAHEKNEENKEDNLLKFLSIESVENVEQTLALCKYSIKKIKEVFPNWKLHFRSLEIVSLSIQNDLLIHSQPIH